MILFPFFVITFVHTVSFSLYESVGFSRSSGGIPIFIDKE